LTGFPAKCIAIAFEPEVLKAVKRWAVDSVIWFAYLHNTWVFTCLPENGNCAPLAHRFVFPFIFPAGQVDCTSPKATNGRAYCVSQPQSCSQNP
jgi:hypothetical protein